MRLQIVPELVVRFHHRIAHPVITVLKLTVHLVISLELRIRCPSVLDGKPVLTEIHVGKFPCNPDGIVQRALRDVPVDRGNNFIITAHENVFLVRILLQSGRIALGILQNEHILLCLLAQRLRSEKLESLAVHHILRGLCRYVEQFLSTLYISTELLPCPLIKCHTRKERPGSLGRHAAFLRNFSIGGKHTCGLLQVLHDKVSHLAPVVLLHIHPWIGQLHRTVYNNGVTIQLEQVEITVRAEEARLADVLLDIFLRGIVFRILQQKIRAADARIIIRIVLVGREHRIRSVAVNVPQILVREQV